jgi:hypothetical protein
MQNAAAKSKNGEAVTGKISRQGGKKLPSPRFFAGLPDFGDAPIRFNRILTSL